MIDINSIDKNITEIVSEIKDFAATLEFQPMCEFTIKYNDPWPNLPRCPGLYLFEVETSGYTSFDEWLNWFQPKWEHPLYKKYFVPNFKKKRVNYHSIHSQQSVKLPLYLNKRIEDLTYREYQHSGLRYILLKITLRIKNIAFDFNKIKGTDNDDSNLSSFVIENSIIVPPDLLTALYLYFFQILHSNVRICPVCFKPFSNRRSDAIACSSNHSNTYKKRKQREHK